MMREPLAADERLVEQSDAIIYDNAKPLLGLGVCGRAPLVALVAPSIHPTPNCPACCIAASPVAGRTLLSSRALPALPPGILVAHVEVGANLVIGHRAIEKDGDPPVAVHAPCGSEALTRAKRCHEPWIKAQIENVYAATLPRVDGAANR